MSFHGGFCNTLWMYDMIENSPQFPKKIQKSLSICVNVCQSLSNVCVCVINCASAFEGAQTTADVVRLWHTHSWYLLNWKSMLGIMVSAECRVKLAISRDEMTPPVAPAVHLCQRLTALPSAWPPFHYRFLTSISLSFF